MYGMMNAFKTVRRSVKVASSGSVCVPRACIYLSGEITPFIRHALYRMPGSPPRKLYSQLSHAFLIEGRLNVTDIETDGWICWFVMDIH